MGEPSAHTNDMNTTPNPDARYGRLLGLLRPFIDHDDTRTEIAKAIMGILDAPGHQVASPEPEPQQEQQEAPKPAPVPKPATVMAKPAPPPPNWRFTKAAREKMAEMDIDAEQVKAVVTNPELTIPASYGQCTSIFGDGLLVLVPNEDRHRIIAVTEDTREQDRDLHLVPPIARRPSGMPRAKSGGSGRKVPSTVKEMKAALSGHGFTVELRSGGHYRITHPDMDGAYTMGASLSDHRAWKNIVADLRRASGIDIAA